MATVSHGAEGEALMDRAAALAPLDPDLAYARAVALERRSMVRFEKADAAVVRALELAPDDPKVLLLKAAVDHGRLSPFDSEAHDRLVADVERLLGLDPHNAEAAYPLATLQATSRAPADRAAGFHDAVRLDPHHGDAIARVDSSLVSPLRGAYWLLWVLVALQAVLLWRGARWGTALNVLLFVFVLVVPWARFRGARRRCRPGSGATGGATRCCGRSAG